MMVMPRQQPSIARESAVFDGASPVPSRLAPFVTLRIRQVTRDLHGYRITESLAVNRKCRPQQVAECQDDLGREQN